ncbi:MAG: NAD(P)H-dependent oxidoreductase subunit E [Spirochaetes bacterium]|nr:NAD(P)H-dependent oxidoreductase subunit E [Spirochaetota bacterium]
MDKTMPQKKDHKFIELKNYMGALKKKANPQSRLIAVLHKTQELYGYLDREIMEHISEFMNIPSAHIWGVATFYHYFNLKPQGKYVISVCMGTACFVKGAELILNKLKKELKIDLGETTPDNLFTLKEARCLGACGLAPVVMVNGEIFGELDQKSIMGLIKTLNKNTEGGVS